MPTIPIHCPPIEGRASTQHPAALPQLLRTPSGLALIEIQGTLNAPAASAQSDNNAYSIGRIVFPLHDSSVPADDTSWHKRVYLYVGQHQRLTGEVKKLAKPIAVLRKRSISTAESQEGLEIVEIVRHKLLFAHRPEPVGGSD